MQGQSAFRRFFFNIGKLFRGMWTEFSIRLLNRFLKKFCDLFRIYELCLRNDPFRTSANWRGVNKSLKLADVLNGRSLIRISAIFLTFLYCSAMIVWMVSCQSGTNVAKFSYFQCLSFVHGALRKNRFVLWIVPEMDTVSWQPFLLLLQSNPLPKIWIIFTHTFSSNYR